MIKGACDAVLNCWVGSEVITKIICELEEEKEHAYSDFDQYKVDYLGQDLEDAHNTLPQDDFRYGMERAIEIINKNIADWRGERKK